MEITKTFTTRSRAQWRSWLARNHGTTREVWLVYFSKASGKSSISYNDAVEEALCFGWIDSTKKKLDANRSAQRFTPRRPGSGLSPMNRERLLRLRRQGLVTPPGLATLGPRARLPLVVPGYVVRALKAKQPAWTNFQKFAVSYKKIRVGWVVGAERRPEERDKRLRYFVKMTAQGKQFGMVR